MAAQTSITFEKTDQLGFKQFSICLESFILEEHRLIEGSLVVSLNAPFGAGKSTFLEMWRNDLLSRRVHAPTLPLPITLNAWESDYCGNPLLALVSALTKTVDNQGQTIAEKSASKKIREAAKDVAWFALGAANGFVSHAVGVDAIQAGEFAQTKKEKRNEEGRNPIDLLSVYEKQKDAISKLRDALSQCFDGDTPKAILFVDELDRCRPNYAIEYLETIKHFFNIRGLIFILAVDKDQLKSSAKALYGIGLNFDEYYRKFAHRNISLLAIDGHANHRFSGMCADRYLEPKWKDGTVRNSTLDYGAHFDYLIEVVNGFALTPRQIQEYFRILGHLMAGERKSVAYPFVASVFFMIGASIKYPEAYRDIGQGKIALNDLATLLKASFGDKAKLEWWSKLILVTYVGEDHENQRLDLYNAMRFINAIQVKTEDDWTEEMIKYTNQLGRNWRYFRLSKIYELIERVENISR